MFEVIAGKLHGVKVTEKALDYHGSITIDIDLLEKAGIPVGVFVYIWNKTNGSRISTYTLPGRRGSKEVCLNGSAARTCELHDEVIIALPRYQHAHEMKSQEAKVVTFNHSLGVNTVGEIIHYVWDEKGGFSLKECPTV